MIMYLQKWKIFSLSIVVISLIAVIFIVGSVKDSSSVQNTNSQEIQIVFPVDGAVFNPGEAITVIVEPGLGISFVTVGVRTKGKFSGEGGIDESSPFEFPITLPNALEPVTIQAFARDQANKLFSTEITVNLSTQALLQSITVEPKSLDFSIFLVQSPLRVKGVFSDGKKITITSPALGTTYKTLSGNSAVVEVSPNGLVKALGNGQDTIVIENNGITATVPVTVEATNTPPSIAPVADQTLELGTTLDIPIIATDPEGDAIKLGGASLPSFITVLDNGNGTGILRLSPTLQDVGSHTIIITALDNAMPPLGGISRMTLSVTAPAPTVAKGDFNVDGCVDRADYGILITDIRNGLPNDPVHDLNGDGVVNRADGRTLSQLFTNSRGASCL